MSTNLGQLLLSAFRWFDTALLAELRDELGIELTGAQSLLFSVLSVDGSRQTDLASELGVSRQAINELVRGLVDQGLVTVEADPGSGRSKLVKPTALGLESIEHALAAFQLIEAELAARIGAGDVGALRRALEHEWGDPPEPNGAAGAGA